MWGGRRGLEVDEGVESSREKGGGGVLRGWPG